MGRRLSYWMRYARAHIVNHLAKAIASENEVPTMLADRLSLGDNDDAIQLDVHADVTIGERRRHAASIAI